ncbi:AraC family transcriptional regulator ligand-binding domain-containing protein [Ectopseudomonas oleovorans]|uniref:helix-turn-helix transcriptional regulator n=1 Tax=Ectopseudomonas oleovorans TaxID=301 RepID=UPI003F19339C
MKKNNLEITIDSSAIGLLTVFLDSQPSKPLQLNERLIILRRERRIPIEIWWSLLDDFHDHFPIAGLGLKIGQGLQAHHAGLLGYLVKHSSTLGQALLRFHRFQPLLHNLVPTEFKLEDDRLILAWGTARKSTGLSDEIFGVALLKLLRDITGDDSLKPLLIRQQWPEPPNVDLYKEFFCCDFEFSSPVKEIHFPKKITSLPISTQDPHLLRLMENQAAALIEAFPCHDNFFDLVKDAILKVLQDGPPTAAAVCKYLDTSERTFYRYLGSRRIKFSDIVRSVRFELAKSYLADSNISLNEIAMILGYADQSVFTRAFKQWSGEAPLNWRKKKMFI